MRTPQSFVFPADYAKEVLLTFFQAFFRENPSHGFHWSPDEDKTNLFIGDKFAYNRSVAERRPSLVTDRGDMRWAGRHIDQKLGQYGMGISHTYNDLIELVVTVNAVAREGLEAEKLGQLAWMLPMLFKEPIRGDARSLNILSTVCGRETILRADSRPDLHLVPVGVLVQVHISWALINDTAQLFEKFRVLTRDPPNLEDLVVIEE